MADFPNNPADGDTYNHPNGQVYAFNGTAWSVVRAGEASLAPLIARIAQLEQQSFFLID